MFRKVLVSLVVAATLGAGMMAMTSAADAHRRHHNGNVTIGLGFFPFLGGGYPAYGFGHRGYGYPGYGYRGFGYPGYGYRHRLYYDDYDDYSDCGYRRVAIKKWNKAHTRRIIVHRKRWVCY
jgi:hypothetical protein